MRNVWQYKDPNGSGQNYIWYGRLVHDTVGGLRLRDTNTLNPITPGLGNNFHPSIDQTQDVWENIQEGVSFESMHAGIKPTVKINFVTLYTPYTSYRTNLQATQQWLLNSVTASSFTTLPPVPLMYPNIASLNTRYDSTTQSKLIEFGIGYYNMVTSQMKQLKAKYDVGFVAGAGQAYTFSGYNSNLSANRVLRAPWSADSIRSKPGGGYDTLHWDWRREYWDRQPVRPATIYAELSGGDSVFRTSKQFLSKLRPYGYEVNGREVAFRINDTVRTGIIVGMHDVWYATDSSGTPLRMLERDTALRRTDSLWQVRDLLRTRSFHGSDSIQIGMDVHGQFYGDSVRAGNARVTCLVELIDSATGSVVRQLDSFVVTSSEQAYYEELTPVLDLVSGTYYVRLRPDTSAMPAVRALPYLNYPVAELSSWVDQERASKLSRLEGRGGSRARISAQPNPFGTSTEVRFSIPKRDYATVTVYDNLGRQTVVLLDHTLMEAGRYALELGGAALQPGIYIIDLKTSNERVVENLVLVR